MYKFGCTFHPLYGKQHGWFHFPYVQSPFSSAWFPLDWLLEVICLLFFVVKKCKESLSGGTNFKTSLDGKTILFVYLQKCFPGVVFRQCRVFPLYRMKCRLPGVSRMCNDIFTINAICEHNKSKIMIGSVRLYFHAMFSCFSLNRQCIILNARQVQGQELGSRNPLHGNGRLNPKY